MTQAESGNPGVTHELVDAILESEQAKGGMESDEKLLRASGVDIPCQSSAPLPLPFLLSDHYVISRLAGLADVVSAGAVLTAVPA